MFKFCINYIISCYWFEMDWLNVCLLFCKHWFGLNAWCEASCLQPEEWCGHKWWYDANMKLWESRRVQRTALIEMQCIDSSELKILAVTQTVTFTKRIRHHINFWTLFTLLYQQTDKKETRCKYYIAFIKKYSKCVFIWINFHNHGAAEFVSQKWWQWLLWL